MKTNDYIKIYGNRGGWQIALPSMPYGGFCAVLATQNNIGPANIIRTGHFPRAAVMEITENGKEKQELGTDVPAK